MDALARMLRKWRYGEAIVIVSGLPRSGTSMVMSMLEAGWLPILSDCERAADEHNPKGYFEYERVKNLQRETDKSWLRLARGKGLKVISHWLETLPNDNFGLDGFDPALAERWMAEGQLPNLKKLAQSGGFSRLQTTYPAIS
ncbi:MAG: hypothetical protein ACREV4_05355 [Gammaproteobacteria bacterium]